MNYTDAKSGIEMTKKFISDHQEALYLSVLMRDGEGYPNGIQVKIQKKFNNVAVKGNANLFMDKLKERGLVEFSEYVNSEHTGSKRKMCKPIYPQAAYRLLELMEDVRIEKIHSQNGVEKLNMMTLKGMAEDAMKNVPDISLTQESFQELLGQVLESQSRP